MVFIKLSSFFPMGFMVIKFNDHKFVIHIVIVYGLVSTTCQRKGLVLKSGEKLPCAY